MLRILIVDDLLRWGELLQRYLSYYNCNVRIATSLDEAERVSVKWQPHLVFLDIHFPPNQYQPLQTLSSSHFSNNRSLIFCKQLNSDPRYGHPIVVITSVDEIGQRKAQEAGAYAFYAKSVFNEDDDAQRVLSSLLAYVGEVKADPHLNSPSPSDR